MSSAKLKEALDVLREVPSHQTFIIPVRVSDCMPKDPELLELQFVDLFPSYEDGFAKLRSALLPVPVPDAAPKHSAVFPMAVRFSQRFGDESRQLLHGLATDRAGNIVVVGDFWGSIKFGDTPLIASGSDRDIFLAKFDRQGNHSWSKSFGDEQEQVGVAVGTDGSGAVYVASAFNGTLQFGALPLVSRGKYNVAIAKLDQHGNHLWSHRFGDENYHVPECISVMPSGVLIVAGRFQGTVDFGSGQIESESEQTDIFLAGFSPNGECLWAKRLGGPFDQQTRSMAVDTEGNIALTGVFKGKIQFDELALTEEQLTSYCGFLVKLDGNGKALWCKRFGEPPVEQGSAVTFDQRSGDLVAAGFMREKLPRNGGVTSVCLIARYNRWGIIKWSQAFGTHAFPDTLSVSDDGHILLTGHFERSIDFGRQVLASEGGYDIFAALFSPSGGLRWADRFGDRWHQFLVSGAFRDDNSVVLAGSFHGSIDFGSGPLKVSGYDDTRQGGNEDVFITILEVSPKK